MVRQYLRKWTELTLYLTMTLVSLSSIRSKTCLHNLLHINKSRLILRTNFFPNQHALTLICLVVTDSSDLVLINYCGYDNQEYCVIHEIRNCHDEVKNSIGDFLAFELKENWLKAIYSLP